jgi:copper transport protein
VITRPHNCVRPRRGRADPAPATLLAAAKRRPALAVVSVVVMAFVALLASAPTASAHASLQSSRPEANQRLEASPAQVVLRFDQGVTVPPGGVRVIDADQRRFDTGGVRVSSAGAVTVNVRPLPVGGYIVAWRAVSEDGHAIRGAFTFQVGEADQSSLRDLTQRLLAGATTEPDVRIATLVAKALAVLGTSLAVSSAVWARLGRPGRADTGATRQLGVGGAVAAALGSLSLLVLLGPALDGRSLAAITDGALFDAALSSRPGRALALATVAGAVLAVSLRARWTRPGSGIDASDGLALGSAATLVGASVLSGHGGSGPLAGLAWSLQGAHVVGAAVWVGLVALLGVAVLAPERSGRLGGRAAVARARRISELITVSVAVVVISGAFAAWRQTRSLDALRSTDYGRLLVLKLGAVALMGLFGWLNRRTLARTADDSPRRLRSFVNAEMAVSVAVIAITAVLSQTEPARDLVGRPLSGTVSIAQYVVEVSLERREAGRNELHLIVTDQNGNRVDPATIDIDATLPSAGIGPIDVQARRAGPGHRIATPRLEIAGAWSFEVRIAIDEFTEETGTITLVLT